MATDECGSTRATNPERDAGPVVIVSIIVQYDGASSTVDYLTIAAVLLVMIVVAIAIDAVEINILTPWIQVHGWRRPDLTYALPRMPPR